VSKSSFSRTGTGPGEVWAVEANTSNASFANVQDLPEDRYFVWSSLPMDMDFHFGNMDPEELALAFEMESPSGNI
jgi:hypothetical protein